ncbi:hypothetical protein ACLOJK_016879 [Asimina triloba]
MALPCHFPLSTSSSLTADYPKFPCKSNHFLRLVVNSNPPRCLRSRHRFRGHKVELVREGAFARIVCFAATAGEVIESSERVKDKSVSVVLLAGGKGKRMGASMPKQYLPLLGQPIALYSFFTFSRLAQVKEIIVVCDPSYRDIFEDIYFSITNPHLLQIFSDASVNTKVDLKFAIPGKERQDSVYNGFQEIDGSSGLVCIHDSARPLVSSADIEKVINDGWLNGAAVLGVPVKATIKEANSESYVVKTLDRKTLWEMQTPQVIKPEVLRNGFELVYKLGLEVTDDVSIVEHLKHPVFITEGSYTNIKVTTPDDLLLAERILNTDANSKIPVPAQ